MFTIILDSLTALTAIVAAIIWFKSAKVDTPNGFSINVVKPGGPFGTPLGGNPIGGTYMGHAYSNDLIDLADALKKQSKLSSIAAIFAGSSAALQSISFLIKAFFPAMNI